MEKKKLPWWTWVLPIAIFHIATRLSLTYQIAPGVSTFYFPVALGFVMVRWWGYRILPALYINSVLSAGLWGINKIEYYPIFGLLDVLEVWLSYLLVKERFKETAWSPNPTDLIIYGVHGVMIPAGITALIAQLFLLLTQNTTSASAPWNGINAFLGDMMGGIALSLPLLIVLTPLMEKRKLNIFPVDNFELQWRWTIPLNEKGLLLTGAIVVLVLSISAPIFRTWYFMGFFVLLPAIWYGLEFSIIVNTFIAFLTLAYPAIAGQRWPQTIDSIQIVATLLTLSFTALVAGSAVSYFRKRLTRVKNAENELKLAKDQAEEASRAKSDFLARMSHEIRTPLNSVLGMLELLKETNLSKDQERYLTLFSHAGENLKALINDLLDFSKIEAKALTIENISYNLHSTIRSVFEILQIKAEEKGLRFELNIANDVPLFQMGDPTRLRQVLFNLIGNALKFTDEGEVYIDVTVEPAPEKVIEDIKPVQEAFTETPEGSFDETEKLTGKTTEVPAKKTSFGKLLIDVRDTGIGIPRDKQQIIFSPFVQGETAITRKYGGTGLGLVISKNLVEIMGGQMELRSLAGRGTTFRIILPHRPDLLGPQEKAKATPAKWPAYFGDRRFKILLVDDSEDNRVLITHYLKSMPFDFVEAVNGKEAVERYNETKFDLIFMDMQMPVMSGYKATELIRHIEKEQHRPHTCIIALTATAVLEDLQRTISSGCDQYMVKPVKKAEVVDALIHALTTKVPDSEAFKEPPSPSI